jgi:hypothetical protein
MSIVGGQAEAALCRELIAFITEGELEKELGRPITEGDRELLAPILKKLEEEKRSGEGGW